jgi:putative polyhydroxyalkanoate system protein
MPRITVERAHSLGRQAARERAEQLAERLEREYGVARRWNGDTLELQRSGVEGRIEVGAEQVRVEVELGVLLAPMSGMLQGKIEELLDKSLA